MPNEPILAVLSTPETAPSVLAAAGSLRARLDGPPILAVHLRPAVEPGFMPTEEVMTEDRAERFRAHEDGLSAALSEPSSGGRQQTRPGPGRRGAKW